MLPKTTTAPKLNFFNRSTVDFGKSNTNNFFFDLKKQQAPHYQQNQISHQTPNPSKFRLSMRAAMNRPERSQSNLFDDQSLYEQEKSLMMDRRGTVVGGLIREKTLLAF